MYISEANPGILVREGGGVDFFSETPEAPEFLVILGVKFNHISYKKKYTTLLKCKRKNVINIFLLIKFITL